MNFFAELKRRNVIRVGIAYIVVAWLVLQFSDVVLNNISAPDWVFQVIMLFLVIGFALVLLFAWAFELTPEGIKRESEVDRSKSIRSQTGQKLNRSIILILALALSYFIYEKLNRSEPGLPEPTETVAVDVVETAVESTEHSIAVLPFVNMSADPEQEYFSDGISEELLNLLVPLEGLKVASRTSSFSYKGSSLSLAEIASELKVGHVLEGSVRKSGSRVRITAQLIDASDDRHLWSETFDRELLDIFAVQDEIANAIVVALRTELGILQDVQPIKVVVETESLDAYQLYFKARALFIARQDFLVSIDLFQQATRLDPKFARAWEGLAAVEFVTDDWLPESSTDHVKAAVEAANHALELDPSLSMAHAVLGSLAMDDDNTSVTDAMRQSDLAVSNDPNNATALLWRGMANRALGYLQKAATDFRQCLVIDAGYMNCKQHLAETLLMQGDEEQGIKLYEQTLEENFHSLDEAFVSYYVRTGQRITALLVADEATNNLYAPVKDWIHILEFPDEDHSLEAARIMQWTKDSNQPLSKTYSLALALGRFDQLQGSRTTAGRYIWHPDSKAFRKSEEFKQYIRQHFLSYWQQNGFPQQCRTVATDDFECD